VFPALLHPYYGWATTSYDAWTVYAVGSIVTPTLSFVLSNLLMYAFYHFEHPMIERYKISDRLWPWNVNRKAWNGLLRKTLLVVIFNMTVTVNWLLCVDYLRGKHLPYRMGLNEYPTAFELVW
jgi:hypothetical protein